MLQLGLNLPGYLLPVREFLYQVVIVGVNKTIYLNAVLLFTGRHVAELQIYIVLAQLMRRFQVEYLEDTPMDCSQKFTDTVPERQLNLAFKGL